MVDVDTGGARAVLSALDPADDAGEALDANGFQFDFYATHLEGFDRQQYRRLVRNPEDVPEGFAVDALADGFEEARDRLGELRDRVDALAAVDTKAVGRDVRRYLPGDPPLDATVHAVVDGFNGGFQHDGDVGMSVLQTAPEEFGPTLRHELHHVGAREVRGDDPLGRLTTPHSPDRDAADLVLTLLLEGLAVAYAQGGLSVYEGDPDLAPVVEGYRQRERELAREVGETIEAVATTADPDRRQERVSAVVTDPEGALPPTHYLGARMVETVGDACGEGRAIELLERPEEFLPAYRRAAEGADAPPFPESAVETAAAATARAES